MIKANVERKFEKQKSVRHKRKKLKNREIRLGESRCRKKI